LGNAHFYTEFVPPQGGGMEKDMSKATTQLTIAIGAVLEAKHECKLDGITAVSDKLTAIADVLDSVRERIQEIEQSN
jgi:hypothetical protein